MTLGTLLARIMIPISHNKASETKNQDEAEFSWAKEHVITSWQGAACMILHGTPIITYVFALYCLSLLLRFCSSPFSYIVCSSKHNYRRVFQDSGPLCLELVKTQVTSGSCPARHNLYMTMPI